jgi:hypothetical protein
MDEFNRGGEISGAAPKMSPEYTDAVLKAMLTVAELGDKITSRAGLSPVEGLLLLNSTWTLYLYALSSGNIAEAKETAELADLVCVYLKLCGYVVTFEDNGYCVTTRKQKGN